MQYHIEGATELYKYYNLYLAKNARIKSLRQPHNDGLQLWSIFLNQFYIHLYEN